MLRLLAIPAVLVTVAVVVAQQPAAPAPAEVAKLVTQLGSEEFAEREAATRRLEEIGPAAIDALRAATTSDNPETARRAFDLLRKAERRLADEKTLAPTLVELDAKDRPLDDVLADLSKQSKYEVILGGLRPAELAGKKVSVATGGKVPFWSAVLKVCEAGDLQIAGVAGFYAPGSMPLTWTAPKIDLGRADIPPMPATGTTRRATNTNRAVVLEARDKPRRPAAVRGAILVEAVPFPKNAKPDQPSALLQAWPEPRLQWERGNELKVARATAADGARLVADPDRPPLPRGEIIGRRGDGVVIVRNPDGTARVVRDTGAFQVAGAFQPNPRQAVVRFQPTEKPAGRAKELGVSVFASVRGAVEPLALAAGLEPNKTATGASNANVDLTVTYRKDGAGKLVASVDLAYDTRLVQPAGVGDDLPGARPGGVTGGNNTVYGIRIADADGKPYTLGLASGANQFDPTGRRVIMKLQLELHPARDGQGPPAAATFWGTASRQVEIPVALKDVPLSGGK